MRYNLLRNSILTSLLIVFSFLAEAQTFELPKEKAVDIKVGGLIYKFHVLIEKTDVELDNSIYYHWFKDGKINKNQGGYSGQLLEGIFSVYSLSGKLLERGQYLSGIKEGEWRKWDVSGQLLQSSHWRNGLKHGEFIDYSNGLAVCKKYKKGKIKQKINLKRFFGFGKNKHEDEK